MWGEKLQWNICPLLCLAFSLIVSVTSSQVETLKYPSFHRIRFFDEIFLKFLKKRVVSINIKIPIYLHLWHRKYKNYFFHAKMCFDNNFYFNKSIYLFFLHNLNNFVNIRTPVVERWLIQMKRLVAAPALLVLSRVLFTIESTTPLRSGWRGRWPT